GLAFSPDGRTVATDWAEADQPEATISVSDTATGQRLRRFPIPRRAMGFLYFAPDGRTLAISSKEPLIHLWDSVTGRQLLKQPAHESSINTVCFTPDGRSLVSGGYDGVRLWDAAAGRQRLELAGHPAGAGASALVVLPDNSACLTGGEDGVLHLYDLRSGQERRRFAAGPVPEKHADPDRRVIMLALAEDGHAATAVTYGTETAAPQAKR